jgi:hypothetical protein
MLSCLLVGFWFSIYAQTGVVPPPPPVQIIYSTPGWLRPRKEHVRQTGACHTPNFQITRKNKRNSAPTDAAANSITSPLPANNGNLPRTYETSKNNKFKPMSPDGAYAYMLRTSRATGTSCLVGTATPIRVTTAASSPDLFSDACGKDRDTYKEGQAGREQRPPVARATKGARVTTSSTGHCDPMTAQAA